MKVTDEESPLYGVRVAVPEGALSAKQTISITSAPVAHNEPLLFDGAVPITPVVHLEPEGSHFDKPVEVFLPLLDGVTLDDSIDWTAYVETDGELCPIPSGADPNRPGVIAFTEHFSNAAAVRSDAKDWTDVDASALFAFAQDTFPISISDSSCGGIVALADWFLRTGKPHLQGAFGAARATEIAQDAHALLGGDQGNLDEIRALTGFSDFIGGRSGILHALLASGHRALLGVFASTADGTTQGHGVMVYAYDAATHSFAVYDPADNSTPRWIAVDLETGQLGEYPDQLIADQVRTDYRFAYADPNALNVAFESGTWNAMVELGAASGSTEEAGPLSVRLLPARKLFGFDVGFSVRKDPAATSDTLYTASTSGRDTKLAFSSTNDYWSWPVDGDEVGTCETARSALDVTFDANGTSAAGDGVSSICAEAPAEVQGSSYSMAVTLSR